MIATYPSVLYLPLLVFCLLCGVTTWGVTRGAQITAENRKTEARSLASEVAAACQQQLSAAFAPVQVLVSLVQLHPSYANISRLFNATAPALASLAAHTTLQALQLAPSGVVRLVTPLAGNEFLLGLDLFAAPDPAILASVRRSMAAPNLSIDGPLPLLNGDGRGSVVVARQAIFVPVNDPEETFGRPDVPNASCGASCQYNASSGMKFWGFAAGMIDLDAPSSVAGALSPMRSLEARGYSFSLNAPGLQSGGVAFVVASSARAPHDPVEAVLQLSDVQWVLCISPHAGWYPAWYGGVLAAVIILSLATAFLLFTVLVSRRRNQMLLAALLPRELIRDLHSGNASCLGPRHFGSESPADLLLVLLGRLLEGEAPDLRDVVLLRTVLLQHRDVYRPIDINSRIKDAKLDGDVASALMRQLGTSEFAGPGAGCINDGDVLLSFASGRSSRHDDQLMCTAKERELQLQVECSSMQGALGYIMAYESEPRGAGRAPSGRAPAPAPASVVDEPVTPASGQLAPQAPFAPSSGSEANPAGTVTVAMGNTSSAASAHGPASSLRRQASAAGQARHSGSGLFLRIGTGGLRRAEGVVGSTSSLSRCVVAVEDGDGDGGGGNGCGGGGGGGGASGGVGGAVGGGGSAGLQQFLSRTVGGASGAPASPLPRRRFGSRRRSVGPARGPADYEPSILNSTPTELSFPGAAGAALNGTTGAGRSGRVPPDAAEALAAPQPAVLAPPPRPLLEEVERLLALTDGWQFDTGALQEASGGHALSVLGFYLIQRAGLVDRFSIEPLALARLLRTLEAGYNPTNPYHNAVHAADVLRTLHVLTRGARLTRHYLDHLGLLAVYFAAIVHDYGHHGLTNDFLVATQHSLALRYNDRCPLESHHCAAAFSLLAERPELDVLAGMTRQERAAFRKQVIELVLATDMKQHFSILTHFTTVHKLAPGSGGAQPLPPPQPQQNGASSPSADTTGGAARRGNSSSLDLSTAADPTPLDETERLLSIQVALKVADLGHLGAELTVHKRWLSVLEEEFFAQGDRERELGLPISPLFDRTKQGVSKSQVGFFQFVAMPLVHAFATAFPGASPLMQCFQANYSYWREVEGAAAPPPAQPPPPPPGPTAPPVQKQQHPRPQSTRKSGEV